MKRKGPKTFECDACAIAKAKRVIRREPKDFIRAPGAQIAVDFFDFETGIDRKNSLVLFTDRYSGYVWDYYLSDRKQKSLQDVFRGFFAKLRNFFEIKPKKIECDEELDKHENLMKWLKEEGVQVDLTAPHTQAQDGAAESSGRVVVKTATAMRVSANLPHKLWSEVTKAAVYLLN